MVLVPEGTDAPWDRSLTCTHLSLSDTLGHRTNQPGLLLGVGASLVWLGARRRCQHGIHPSKVWGEPRGIGHPCQDTSRALQELAGKNLEG